MITNLFSAWCSDVLQDAVKKGEQTPFGLSESVFAESLEEVVVFLGSKSSLFSDPKFLKEQPLVKEFVSFLGEELPKWIDKDILGGDKDLSSSKEYLKSIFSSEQHGMLLGVHVLIEEAQKLVEIVLGVKPVRLHVAKAPKAEDAKHLLKELRLAYPGSIPLLKTDTSLLGGARLFVGDSLIDHSWVTRVHTFLSALS